MAPYTHTAEHLYGVALGWMSAYVAWLLSPVGDRKQGILEDPFCPVSWYPTPLYKQSGSWVRTWTVLVRSEARSVLEESPFFFLASSFASCLCEAYTPMARDEGSGPPDRLAQK